MTAIRKRVGPRRRKIAFWTTLVLMAVGLVLVLPAAASHGLATLAGSNFEIDDNANLKLDHSAPAADWGSLAHPNGPEIRAIDVATGQSDDSYSGGTKEDTACPNETTGSIPNNKSDLLTFHVYEEPGSGTHPGFLNLAWSRVSDPSGTTLMDFEFNQSSTNCSSGPNKLRTAGDLLIEYAIDQGGARADISGRFWTGSAWGPSQDLDAPSAACGNAPCAVGTINQSVIPVGEADGLTAKQPRTFGEAQIDLRLIFDEGSCTSFGSAMLKSRSSDSFTSQLKDFIRPRSIDLQNCGNVIIRKQTIPDEDPNTTDFGYTKSFDTDPASANTFTLKDDAVQNYNDTVLFGTGYTVDEDVIPAGWEFVSLDCSASSGVTPVISDTTVTFDINADTDVLDCTYTNQALGTIIVEKITDDGTGSFDFTSGTLSPASFTLTTTAAGAGGKDSETFGDLPIGTYDVAETVPAGWNLVSAACDDGSDPASIGLSAGETVTCTFHDERQKGAILITKTRKHAADGLGVDHPHQGVDFEVSGGSLSSTATVTTNADGQACVDGLVLSSFVGDYTVHEVTPNGYNGEPDVTVTVDTEATCEDDPYIGEEVSFHNTPLTDLTVSVDSQVDGGTGSTIDCVLDSATIPAGTPDNGDGSLTLSDLEPGTYNCEIVIDP